MTAPLAHLRVLLKVRSSLSNKPTRLELPYDAVGVYQFKFRQRRDRRRHDVCYPANHGPISVARTARHY